MPLRAHDDAYVAAHLTLKRLTIYLAIYTSFVSCCLFTHEHLLLFYPLLALSLHTTLTGVGHTRIS